MKSPDGTVLWEGPPELPTPADPGARRPLGLVALGPEATPEEQADALGPALSDIPDASSASQPTASQPPESAPPASAPPASESPASEPPPTAGGPPAD